MTKQTKKRADIARKKHDVSLDEAKLFKRHPIIFGIIIPLGVSFIASIFTTKTMNINISQKIENIEKVIKNMYDFQVVELFMKETLGKNFQAWTASDAWIYYCFELKHNAIPKSVLVLPSSTSPNTMFYWETVGNIVYAKYNTMEGSVNLGGPCTSFRILYFSDFNSNESVRSIKNESFEKAMNILNKK